MQADARRSFLLISLAVPVMCSTAGLLGVIEAHQRFTLANAIRTPMGVFYYAGPLLVLPFSRELFPIVALLAGGRLVASWVDRIFDHRARRIDERFGT